MAGRRFEQLRTGFLFGMLMHDRAVPEGHSLHNWMCW